jgi:hypothetical protein
MAMRYCHACPCEMDKNVQTHKQAFAHRKQAIFDEKARS